MSNTGWCPVAIPAKVTDNLTWGPNEPYRDTGGRLPQLKGGRPRGPFRILRASSHTGQKAVGPMAERHAELDTRISISTPENIAFDYRIAGPFQRLPAYLLDFLIRSTAFFVMAILVLIAGGWEVGAAWALILFFALDIFYGGFFETVWNGQTPGKRMLNLRVVTIEGEPISPYQAVLRNILRIADGFPYVGAASAGLPLFQVGLFSMMATRRYQRVGDLVCGTIVVTEEPQTAYGVMHVMSPDAIALAADIPASFEVPRSLGLALSSYAHRRLMFGWARRDEIARHLGEPLRQRLGLEHHRIGSYDTLLCALYHKAFVEERPGQEVAGYRPTSPFAPPQPIGPPGVAPQGWPQPGAAPQGPWQQQPPGNYAYGGYGPPGGGH